MLSDRFYYTTDAPPVNTYFLQKSLIFMRKSYRYWKCMKEGRKIERQDKQGSMRAESAPHPSRFACQLPPRGKPLGTPGYADRRKVRRNPISQAGWRDRRGQRMLEGPENMRAGSAPHPSRFACQLPPEGEATGNTGVCGSAQRGTESYLSNRT